MLKALCTLAAVQSVAAQDDGADSDGCQAERAKLQSEAAELRQQLQDAQKQASASSAGQETLDRARADLLACQKGCEGEKHSLQEKLQQAASQHNMEKGDLAQKLQEATATSEANEGSLREQLRDSQRETADYKERLESVKAQMEKSESSLKAAQQLQAENTLLKQKLQNASAVWLPLWTHGHYDSYVAPGVKLYNDEIASGRILQRSASATQTAYKSSKQYLGPSASAAYKYGRAVWDPAYHYAASGTSYARDVAYKEFSKDRYKWAHGANSAVAKQWQLAAKQARALHNHQHARRAKQFATSQRQRLERDLQRIIANVLKADVPGSGIDPEFVQVLAWGVMYGLPLLLLMILLGRACRVGQRPARKQGKQQSRAPHASSSNSSSSKRGGSAAKASKRRK